MGWGPLESRIEEHRKALRADPRRAEMAIRGTLTKAVKPRDRVRLLGLLAATHRHRRAWDQAENLIRIGETIHGAGDIARAELAEQLALLHVAKSLDAGNDWSRTRDTAAHALALARTIPWTEKPRTKWASRQNRTRAERLASAYIIHGQVELYGYSATCAALHDVHKALRYADQASVSGQAHRAHLAACSLLVACALRGGTPEDLRPAAEVLDVLLLRLPTTDVISRAQISGSYACLLTRLGHPEEAEYHLIAALDSLREVGAVNAYNQLLDLLEWVVRSPQRAAELLPKLRSQAPFVPRT